MLSMVETAALPGPLGILTDLLIACREVALKLLASESSVGDGVVVIQGTNCTVLDVDVKGGGYDVTRQLCIFTGSLLEIGRGNCWLT